MNEPKDHFPVFIPTYFLEQSVLVSLRSPNDENFGSGFGCGHRLPKAHKGNGFNVINSGQKKKKPSRGQRFVALYASLGIESGNLQAHTQASLKKTLFIGKKPAHQIRDEPL